MVSRRSDKVDISRIAGDAPDHVKAFLADPTTLDDVSGQSQTVRGFGYDIISRMEVTDVSVTKKVDEPLKQEGRVVVKMKVEQGAHLRSRSALRSRELKKCLFLQDMVHGGLNMHGGCSAFLIDTFVLLESVEYPPENSYSSRCTTLAMTALTLGTVGAKLPNVSLALDILYHAPAAL